LSGRLAVAEIEEKIAETELEYADASALLSGWEGGSDARVTIAKAHRALNEDAKLAKKDYLEVYAYRKLMKVMYDSVERDSALISRELTRRTTRDPYERRADRGRA